MTFMIQLVRKTMMVGAMPSYYSKRKYSMQPKEEKPDAETAKTMETADIPVSSEAKSTASAEAQEEDNASVTSSTVDKPEGTTVSSSTD